MKLSRITLLVRGMSCAACVHRVEQALTGLEGVSRAEINLATEKATIEYKAQLVSQEKINEKISLIVHHKQYKQKSTDTMKIR